MQKNKNKKFDWIFFDLDGTLADSFPALYQVHLNFMAKFGIKSNKEEFEELDGPLITEAITILKKRYKLSGNEGNLLNLYRSAIVDAYGEIKLFNGAEAVLKELKNKGCKLLLVTSADREIAMEFIKKQKLEKYFQNYVFGDEVKKAKPDPEIYNLALKKAGAVTESVAVVEDSYNGIKSAKAAGIFVIGLANNQAKEDLLKVDADAVILELKEILPIL